MTQITIAGQQFEVASPYAAGHTLTEAEAHHLNQTRRENVRNNMARAVKDGLEKGTSLDELATAVSAYDTAYEFNLPGTGGGAVSRDPILTEARKLARDMVKAHMKKTNQSASAEAIEAAVQRLLAHEVKGAQITSTARANVEARQAAAAQLMEDIVVDDIDVAA